MSEINAIATNNYILHNIDAKKLYVQEPLFTANSGDAVYVGWRPDETVLFENQTNSTASMELSEPPSAFNYLKLYGYWTYNGNQCLTTFIEIPTNRDRFSMFGNGAGNLNAGTYNMFECVSDYEVSGNTITVRKCIRKTDSNGLISYDDGIVIQKIVGIGRKS